jgi:hypothetical protein
MEGMYSKFGIRNSEISLYFFLLTGILAETGSLGTASTSSFSLSNISDCCGFYVLTSVTVVQIKGDPEISC